MALPAHSTALFLALCLGGIHAGSFAFVSAVSTRALGILASSKEAATLRAFFRVWWPAGRDWMAPLSISAAAAYAWLAVSAPAMTAGGVPPPGGQAAAACAAVAALAIVVWTVAIMGEDIASLRGTGAAADDRVAATAHRFCSLHHVRTVLSVGSFVGVLWTFSS
ncbi:hypothetical protein MMPV_005520 [Pyropia vietnamensis]